ncbi:hypothetical protein D3C80_1617450 [compost metagenome]
MVMDVLCRPGKINPGLALVDFRRINDAFFRLRNERKIVCFQLVHRLPHQPRACQHQAVVQFTCRGILTDRDLGGQRHRAGIQPLFHFHDHHARLGIASHDRPLNGSSAAPARQQRGVAVIAAKARTAQDSLGQ